MELDEIVKSIASKVSQPRPKNPTEMAELIWELFQLQVTRLMALAGTAKLYAAPVTRDFEALNKMADLYFRCIGGPAAPVAKPDAFGINADIMKLVARGDREGLKKLLDSTDKSA